MSDLVAPSRQAVPIQWLYPLHSVANLKCSCRCPSVILQAGVTGRGPGPMGIRPLATVPAPRSLGSAVSKK